MTIATAEQTVTIKGREYRVTVGTNADAPYILIGARGRQLIAIRNRPSGNLHILENNKSIRDTGARFSDATGQLVDVKEGRQESAPITTQEPLGAPQQREMDDRNYGWQATEKNLYRHVAEMAEAISTHDQRDREDRRAVENFAGRMLTLSRSISADAQQLARLSHHLQHAGQW